MHCWRHILESGVLPLLTFSCECFARFRNCPWEEASLTLLVRRLCGHHPRLRLRSDRLFEARMQYTQLKILPSMTSRVLKRHPPPHRRHAPSLPLHQRHSARPCRLTPRACTRIPLRLHTHYHPPCRWVETTSSCCGSATRRPDADVSQVLRLIAVHSRGHPSRFFGHQDTPNRSCSPI